MMISVMVPTIHQSNRKQTISHEQMVKSQLDSAIPIGSLHSQQLLYTVLSNQWGTDRIVIDIDHKLISLSTPPPPSGIISGWDC